jgi:1-acyl-sn-glycerol-3-phosphate acyltransferase
MNKIPKFLSFIYSLYVGILFIIFTILVLPIIFLSVALPPKKRGDAIYSLCRFAFDLMFILSGIRHKNIIESNGLSKAPMVYVYNHISYLDAIIIVKTIRHHSIRALGKVEITSIPVIGYIYKQAVITVKRESPEDRKRSVEKMKQAIKEGSSIIIAPEGTFNMTDKPLSKFYDGAFRIALQTRTPITPVLLLDTFRRMHYDTIFSLTPGRSRSVLLDPIPVDDFKEDEVERLREHVYQVMEKALIRYNASWLKK